MRFFLIVGVLATLLVVALLLANPGWSSGDGSLGAVEPGARQSSGDELSGPELSLVEAVRSIVAPGESPPEQSSWVMQGAIEGVIQGPARFSLSWRAIVAEGEVSSTTEVELQRPRADDLVVPVDEQGAFQLIAPMPDWQPFSAYRFAVVDGEGSTRHEGWCVLDRALVIALPEERVFSGCVLDSHGAGGEFEFGFRMESAGRGSMSLGQGSTDEHGCFRHRVSVARLPEHVYVGVRSRRSGRLALFQCAVRDLIAGSVRLRIRDVIVRVSVVDEEGRAPEGLVVRAAVVDALGHHLVVAAVFDPTLRRHEVVCAGGSRLEVVAQAPGCRPERAVIDVPGDVDPVEMGQVVLHRRALDADVLGDVADAHGVPVPHANVLVIPDGWGLETAADFAVTSLVDERAQFRIPVDAGGTYRVIVQHPRYPQFTASTPGVVAGRPVRIVLPLLGGIRLHPRAAGALGQSAWSRPLSYAIVPRSETASPSGGVRGDLWSLDQVLPLVEGAYSIHVCSQDLGLYGYAECEVPPGAEAQVELLLTPTRRVEGRVEDRSGRPVGHAWVQLSSGGLQAEFARDWFAAKADGAGEFSLVVPELRATILLVGAGDASFRCVVDPGESPVRLRLP